MHVRHEEHAALAAVGHARFTGRPAACVATPGPGALHLMNGLYDGRIDGAPVLAITGMTYHDLVGTHFLQDIDSARVLEPACVFSERVMGPAHAVALTDRAVRAAFHRRDPHRRRRDGQLLGVAGDAPGRRSGVRPGRRRLRGVRRPARARRLAG